MFRAPRADLNAWDVREEGHSVLLRARCLHRHCGRRGDWLHLHASGGAGNLDLHLLTGGHLRDDLHLLAVRRHHGEGLAGLNARRDHHSHHLHRRD